MKGANTPRRQERLGGKWRQLARSKRGNGNSLAVSFRCLVGWKQEEEAMEKTGGVWASSGWTLKESIDVGRKVRQRMGLRRVQVCKQAAGTLLLLHRSRPEPTGVCKRPSSRHKWKGPDSQ